MEQRQKLVLKFLSRRRRFSYEYLSNPPVVSFLKEFYLLLYLFASVIEYESQIQCVKMELDESKNDDPKKSLHYERKEEKGAADSPVNLKSPCRSLQNSTNYRRIDSSPRLEIESLTMKLLNGIIYCQNRHVVEQQFAIGLDKGSTQITSRTLKIGLRSGGAISGNELISIPVTEDEDDKNLLLLSGDVDLSDFVPHSLTSLVMLLEYEFTVLRSCVSGNNRPSFSSQKMKTYDDIDELNQILRTVGATTYIPFNGSTLKLHNLPNSKSIKGGIDVLNGDELAVQLDLKCDPACYLLSNQPVHQYIDINRDFDVTDTPFTIAFDLRVFDPVSKTELLHGESIKGCNKLPHWEQTDKGNIHLESPRSLNHASSGNREAISFLTAHDDPMISHPHRLHDNKSTNISGHEACVNFSSQDPLNPGRARSLTETSPRVQANADERVNLIVRVCLFQYITITCIVFTYSRLTM